MNVELEYVEHDNNYVTVTDAIGQIHYLFISAFDKDQLKKAEAGDMIDADLSNNFMNSNGIVEF